MSSTIARAVATFVACAVLTVAPASADAAVPSNDDFADAIVLDGPAGTIAGNTSEATVEPGEPCDYGCAPSVWFRWKSTLPAPATATFSLCGSAYDTALNVYTDVPFAQMSTVAQNDDACGAASSVTFVANPGAVYAIRVGGRDVASGAYTLSHPAGSALVSEVDVTPPVLAVPTSVHAVATSASGASVTWTTGATDDVDGNVAVTCAPASGSQLPLGMTLVGCSAIDAAGNVATQLFPVFVSFTWSGVLAPLNADGTSIYKRNAVIPVKFRLTGASAGITDAIASISVVNVTNAILGVDAEQPLRLVATDGTLFRYTADGTYIYNLSTKGWARGTYRIRIDLRDGEQRAVEVSVR